MKKTTIYAATTIGLMALAATGLFVGKGNISSIFAARADSPVVYKHYNAIAPTDNEHGCNEFWVNCSDYSYVLEQPTSGTIVEGGDITDNPNFDWNNMDVLDGRFIPSINQQKAYGMVPVLDQENNKITFGSYPQSRVTDSDTINALDALTDSDKYENGYYYYNGNFYQTCIGEKRDNDNHFSDGTKVVNGTKYWFICEPISWVIMENSGSDYLVYSEYALHGGLTWGYSDADIYETSRVREWLNGIGGYNGNGFYQAALFPGNVYLQDMALSLFDGSEINDKVRLLTEGEAKDTTYFANDNARKVNSTDWTAAHKVCFNNDTDSHVRWWLCEANTEDATCAWGVGIGGAVGDGGKKTSGDSYDRAERPVITVTIA